MNDFALQRFSDRLVQAEADGTISAEQARLARSALEGGGMEAALEALRGSVMAKAGDPAANGNQPAPEPSQADSDPLLSIAEDKADLRDALNRDLGSEEAVDLIRKIAAAYAASEDGSAAAAG